MRLIEIALIRLGYPSPASHTSTRREHVYIRIYVYRPHAVVRGGWFSRLSTYFAANPTRSVLEQVSMFLETFPIYGHTPDLDTLKEWVVSSWPPS